MFSSIISAVTRLPLVSYLTFRELVWLFGRALAPWLCCHSSASYLIQFSTMLQTRKNSHHLALITSHYLHNEQCGLVFHLGFQRQSSCKYPMHGKSLWLF